MLLTFLTSGAASSACSGKLTSCHQADVDTFFNAMSCTCYSCTKENSTLSYSCSRPYSSYCSGKVQVDYELAETNPTWSNADYAAICAVYIGVNGIVFLLVRYLAPRFSTHVAPQEASSGPFRVVAFIKKQVFNVIVARSWKKTAAASARSTSIASQRTNCSTRFD